MFDEFLCSDGNDRLCDALLGGAEGVVTTFLDECFACDLNLEDGLSRDVRDEDVPHEEETTIVSSTVEAGVDEI